MWSGRLFANLFSSGGNIHIPRQRLLERSRRILFCLTTKAWFSVSCFVRGRAFFSGRISGFGARQKFLTGQIQHLGLRGRQIRAPRSTSAELKRAARRLGTSCLARFQRISRPMVLSIGACKSKMRAKTRAVLASTIGTDRWNAKLATAWAVYFPIPGSCCI